MTRNVLFTTSAAALMAFSIAAGAADLPPTYPPLPVSIPPLPPSYSWTGFYAGGTIGGAWADGSLADRFTGVRWSTSQSGVIGGLQAGFNYQFSNIILGAESDLDWTELNATATAIAAPGHGPVLQASTNTQRVTTVAARLGVALDNWLLYGKGGGGWVGDSATLTNLSTGASWSTATTNAAWLLAAGLEYAFAPNWTAKLEYGHLGLGNWTAATASFPNDSITVNRGVQMLKLGISYKFGGSGPASY